MCLLLLSLVLRVIKCLSSFSIQRHGKDSNTPSLEYGEISFVHHTPFLGQLAQGQTLQVSREDFQI